MSALAALATLHALFAPLHALLAPVGVDAEDATDGPCRGSDGTAYHAADWPRSPIAVFDTALGSAHGALGLR